jgi:hypothetical protein
VHEGRQGTLTLNVRQIIRRSVKPESQPDTLHSHWDQPPDVVARDVVERRRAVSLAYATRDNSHPPIGRWTYGAARFQA